jgi:hypothetical protein
MRSLRQKLKEGNDDESVVALGLLGALLCLAIHWFVLTIAALAAPPRTTSCVAPCTADSFQPSPWTLLLLLPELSLVVGALAAGTRRRVSTFLWSLLGAFGSLALVTIVLISDVSLRHALPAGPLFGLGR